MQFLAWLIDCIQSDLDFSGDKLYKEMDLNEVAVEARGKEKAVSLATERERDPGLL